MSEPNKSSNEPSLVQRLGSRLLRGVREWGVSLLLAAVVFHLVGQLRAPDLPAVAPDFDLEVLDGERVRLSQLRGKPVVLNFWAAWCGPCRVEVPQLNSFAENNPEVVVLGIATDGQPAELRAAAKKLDIGYPVVLADRPTVAAYQVTTLPTTVFVDAQGAVAGAHTGIITRPQLELLVP